MNAYDYDRQVWVEGTEGDKLSLKQTRDELDLLTNPDTVAGYCKLIGIQDAHRTAYIETMRVQARQLVRRIYGETEETYSNLCRFSDLCGFSFGYGGGAKRASQLIRELAGMLTFDKDGNITGSTDRKALSLAVAMQVKQD